MTAQILISHITLLIQKRILNAENLKDLTSFTFNAMYDLLNKTYTDIVIQPGRTENEHKAFCDMVDRYNGNNKTIFITDRGYESYNNIAHVIEKGTYFLFRCKRYKQ